MEPMNKTERVKAAIAFEETDRIPLGLWPHFTPYDQETGSLIEMHYKFYDEMDLDYVKLMPYGLYGIEDYGIKIKKYNLPDQWATVEEKFIRSDADWDKIVPLDVTKGTYGRQLDYAAGMLKKMKENHDEAPVIHTVFSPLTTLYKLIGWEQLKISLRRDPEQVHRALKAITKTTCDFIRENLNLGVSGFFFASQLANYKFMDDEGYDVFGETYDRQVLDAARAGGWFNVVHIHSFTQEAEKSMFRRLAAYPVECVNWHDRWVGPSLSQAREITDKCLIGGINEEGFLNKVNYEKMYEHVRQAVEAAGARGFMLGPGCTIYENTPLENYLATCVAARKYGAGGTKINGKRMPGRGF